MYHYIFIPKWTDDSNNVETFGLVILPFMILAYIFLLCEPGMMMTGRFEMFGEELGRCAWYLFPVELQRVYMVFLSDVQNSIRISCYGNITCERDTSKRVLLCGEPPLSMH